MLLLALLLVPAASEVHVPQKLFNYTDIIPNNVTIPSVSVSPAILHTYGLFGDYRSEPANNTRPTKEQAAAFWAKLSTKMETEVLEKFVNKTPIDVAKLITTIWANETDNTTRAYFQWATAHVLNLFNAVHSMRLPAEEVAEDCLAIAMGRCRVPTHPRLGSTFSRIVEAVGGKAGNESANCEVSQRERKDALHIIKEVSNLSAIWRSLLGELTTGIFQKTIPYPPSLIRELYTEAAAYNPYLATFAHNYLYLIFREAATLSNQTVVDYVESGEFLKLAQFETSTEEGDSESEEIDHPTPDSYPDDEDEKDKDKEGGKDEKKDTQTKE